MQKQVLFLFVFIVFFLVKGISQVRIDKEGRITECRSVFNKKYFNVYLHTSLPLGDIQDRVLGYSSFQLGRFGIGKGIGINIGQTFYLSENSLMATDDFRFGIEAIYGSFTIHPTSNFASNNNYESQYGDVFEIATGIGPTFSAKVNEDILIGGRFMVLPTWREFYVKYETWDFNSWEQNYIDAYNTGFTVRNSLGAYIRYRPYYFAVDFKFGGGEKIWIESYEDDGNRNPVRKEEVVRQKFDSFNISFGFSF